MPKSLLDASEPEGWPTRSTIPWDVTRTNSLGMAAGLDANGAVGQMPRSDNSSSQNSRSSNSPSGYYSVSQPGAIGTASISSPPRPTTINHVDEASFIGADQFHPTHFDSESQNQQFNMNGITFGTFNSIRPDASPRDFASPPNELHHGVGSPFHSRHDTQASAGLPISPPPFHVPNQFPEDQAEALKLRLHGIRQMQNYPQSTINGIPPGYRMISHPVSDMSHLAGMFMANGLGGMPNGVPSLGPNAEEDFNQPVRSKLLTEFRFNHNKGSNKRYELKVCHIHLKCFQMASH